MHSASPKLLTWREPYRRRYRPTPTVSTVDTVRNTLPGRYEVRIQDAMAAECSGGHRRNTDRPLCSAE